MLPIRVQIKFRLERSGACRLNRYPFKLKKTFVPLHLDVRVVETEMETSRFRPRFFSCTSSRVSFSDVIIRFVVHTVHFHSTGATATN